jgi:hypothetical protein
MPWASGYVPHASKKLNKTTVSEGEGNDNVGGCNAPSPQVDGRQNKGGEGESTETERSRVGELAALDGPVETGLELTTEGRESGILAGVNVS